MGLNIVSPIKPASLLKPTVIGGSALSSLGKTFMGGLGALAMGGGLSDSSRMDTRQKSRSDFFKMDTFSYDGNVVNPVINFGESAQSKSNAILKTLFPEKAIDFSFAGVETSISPTLIIGIVVVTIFFFKFKKGKK